MGALLVWASRSDALSSSWLSASSLVFIAIGGGASSSSTLVCCAPSVGATTGAFSDEVFASGKIEVNRFNCSSPDSLKGGGMLPFNVSVNCLAACTTASWGVTVGAVMYLCLKNIVSDPCTALESVQYDL